MKKAFSALVLAIVLAASSALAAEVKYIFATPGVV